jgi:hypothetical protein
MTLTPVAVQSLGNLGYTVVDAAGDLIVGTSNDTVARLPVGSDGQVLTAVGGMPTWRPPQPPVAVVSGSTQTPAIPNTTDTAIKFANAEIDANGPTPMFAAGTPDRLTIKVAGLYLVTAYVQFAVFAATLQRRIRIDTAGSVAIAIGGQTMVGTGSVDMQLATTGVISLAVNDYVRAIVYQDSGAAQQVQTARMAAIRLA